MFNQFWDKCDDTDVLQSNCGPRALNHANFLKIPTASPNFGWETRACAGDIPYHAGMLENCPTCAISYQSIHTDKR